MSILGATQRFIKLPYIIEGIIITSVSCLLSSAVIYFLYQFVIAGVTFNEATYGIREIAEFFSFNDLLIVFTSLILIGAFSSAIATDKVLKQLSSFERFSRK